MQGIERAQRLFQRDDHSAFHVLCRRPGPSNAHVDEIEGKIGKKLPVELILAEHTSDDHQHHQQVRSDPVCREQAQPVSPGVALLVAATLV